MRKLLNTLHVMTQGAYLHRDGETVSVKVGTESKLRLPVHTLEGLVCWGQVSCSAPVLALCCEHGIGISFLTEQGRFLARVQGPISGTCFCGVSSTAWQMAGKQHFRWLVPSSLQRSRTAV